MNKLFNSGLKRALTFLLILICVGFVVSQVQLFALSVMGRIEIFEYPKATGAHPYYLLSGEEGFTRSMNLGYLQIYLQKDSEIYVSTRILIGIMSFISLFPIIACGYFVFRVLLNIYKQNYFMDKNTKYLLYCSLLLLFAAILTRPINSHLIPPLVRTFSSNSNVLYVQYDISHDGKLLSLSLLFYVISCVFNHAKEKIMPNEPIKMS